MLQLRLIAAAIAAIALLYYTVQALALYIRRNKIKKANKCQPPSYYPHKYPLGLDYILASAKALKEERLLANFEADLEKYGPTFQANQFGIPILVSKDPKVIKAALATDFDSWGVRASRYDATAEFFGEGFFVLDGHGWKVGRAQARPALTKNEYGDLARLEKHVARFLQLIPRDGSMVNLRDPFHRLLSSFSAEYFFGRHVDILAKEGIPEKDGALIEAIDTAMVCITTRLMKGAFVKYLPMEKGFRESSRTVRDFVDESIEEAMQRSEKGTVQGGGTFLDELVAQGLDRKAIQNASITLYIGGTDTTASTLTSTCWTIAKYPEVVARVREEILEFAPPGTHPTLQDLNKMTYLKNVIRESMRLYGFTNTVAIRDSTKDNVLPVGGGVDQDSPLFVKKGTRLIMDWRSMHRDPRWWGADAGEFKPDRWLNSGHLRYNWYFQVFGGGPRACPGQNLAFTNMMYTLTRIFQEFKSIESRDDSPWIEHMKFGAEHKYGCQVVMIPA